MHNLISYSETLLLKMQLLEKSISELDNVNRLRGGEKKQCQIPTWGVGTPGVGCGDPGVGGGAWNWQAVAIRSDCISLI